MSESSPAAVNAKPAKAARPALSVTDLFSYDIHLIYQDLLKTVIITAVILAVLIGIKVGIRV